MNSLFRKKANVGGYVPPTLVNLALRGNKVMKFFVVRRKNLVPTNRNELVIPLYDYKESDWNEQLLVKIAIKKMKIFRDMKFRAKYPEILHIAQFIYANRIVQNQNYDLCRNIASSLGYESAHEYELAIEKKMDDNIPIDKNERKFMSLRHALAPVDFSTTVSLHESIVRDILNNVDIDTCYRKYVVATGFTDTANTNGTRDNLESYIRQRLSNRYPVGTRIPETIIKKDVEHVLSILSQFKDGVYYAKRYANYMKLDGGTYWDKDYVHSNWDNSETYTGGYRFKKLSTSQIRRRINKITSMLSSLVNNSDYWQSWRLNHLVLDDGTIALNSDEYLEELAKYDTIADEYDETLTLPDNISDELAERIMEDADKQFQRHLVDYWSNPSGVHGKAIIKRFTPTNTIHKAVREIAKRNSDRGVVPKNMYRMTTDKKVFTNKSTVAGGSMLVDFSGSMGFTADDVREIIDDLPAANIAGYVGYHDKIDGYDGMIKIIALDGRIDTNAIEELGNYGANSVDFDGLKWLAQQPEPRIWISDQQVVGVDAETGHASNLNKEDRNEIARFMKRNNIIPIRVVEDVKKVAKQLAK